MPALMASHQMWGSAAIQAAGADGVLVTQRIPGVAFQAFQPGCSLVNRLPSAANSQKLSAIIIRIAINARDAPATGSGKLIDPSF
jgi:hypothetical protein